MHYDTFYFFFNDAIDLLKNTEDNSDVERSSNEDEHDLFTLPPVKKANSQTDIGSDASDDMKDGVVHHLSRCLLNSTCDSSLLDKWKSRNQCNALNHHIRNKKNQLQGTGKKAVPCSQIWSKWCNRRIDRNNQVTYWCIQRFVFWWLGFACDKSN